MAACTLRDFHIHFVHIVRTYVRSADMAYAYGHVRTAVRAYGYYGRTP